MIGRILGFFAWILMAPPVLGNMLVRSLLFPAPRPPMLRSAGIERTGRIAHVLGIVLVVWAAILGDISGREAFGSAVSDAFTDALVGLLLIGALIVCTAVLFIAIARRGSRRAMCLRVLIPVGAFLGYLAVVVGSGLLAGALVPLGEWARSRISEGFWWVLLTVLVMLVMLFLVSLFMAALAMGTWYGGTQLFRSADAHPLFPTVVGLGMAGISAAIMIWQLLSRGPEPGGAFGLLVLVFGPTTAVLLCLIEGVWLLRAPRSVRFREVYRPV